MPNKLDPLLHDCIMVYTYIPHNLLSLMYGFQVYPNFIKVKNQILTDFQPVVLSVITAHAHNHYTCHGK
jgi:hypothetical protein